MKNQNEDAEDAEDGGVSGGYYWLLKINSI